MKASSCRYAARWKAFATAAVGVCLLTVQSGCVSSKYRMARKDTPPVQVLNLAFPPAPPLQATLAALITYGGPGSWKRQALWDEYVVEIVNRGERPLVIASATLVDSKGVAYAIGTDPWALEKQSKMLEQQYKHNGEAFLRAAGPGVGIVGLGAIAGTTATAAFVSPVLAGAAVAAVFVLPVYYVSS